MKRLLSHPRLARTLSKIFEYRSLKLVWFIPNPQLTYGHALESLSDLPANASEFAIAMPTTSKVEEMNRPIKPANKSSTSQP
jgi:hypothetical protein